MKVRNGFVSNSSSSSFVVLLPENFLKTIDYENITQGNEDFPLDQFKEVLEKLVNENGIYLEEIYEYDEEDSEFINIIEELIEPYTIADMDSGPDEGQIIVADVNKVKKILSL